MYIIIRIYDINMYNDGGRSRAGKFVFLRGWLGGGCGSCGAGSGPDPTRDLRAACPGGFVLQVSASRSVVLFAALK